MKKKLIQNAALIIAITALAISLIGLSLIIIESNRVYGCGETTELGNDNKCYPKKNHNDIADLERDYEFYTSTLRDVLPNDRSMIPLFY